MFYLASEKKTHHPGVKASTLVLVDADVVSDAEDEIKHAQTG